MNDYPRLYRFFDSDSIIVGREKKIEKDLQLLQNKHQGVLQSAR